MNMQLFKKDFSHLFSVNTEKRKTILLLSSQCFTKSENSGNYLEFSGLSNGFEKPQTNNFGICWCDESVFPTTHNLRFLSLFTTVAQLSLSLHQVFSRRRCLHFEA